jgi:hypothetical protein
MPETRPFGVSQPGQAERLEEPAEDAIQGVVGPKALLEVGFLDAF